MDARTATEPVSVKDAPAIPGLSFRHFRGDSDYPIILDINTRSKIADGMGHDIHTLDSITHVYSNTPNHDPYNDTLFAEINGMAVAFNRVYMERELEGPRIYNHVGFVVPEWRGKGIGRAMLRWAESRAREIEATQTEEAPALAGTEVYSGAPGLENLLKEEGYEPVRYGFAMQTPNLDNIPEAPMPEGLEVRPASPEHYRAIWEANKEAFRDHWGATEEKGDFEEWLKHPFVQPDLWMVGWDGDQVAGSILNFIDTEYNEREGHKVGYTEWITVRRPWRRRGLARALLSRSMKMHKELGMERTALGVDTENPTGALQLYLSMGYREIARSTMYRKAL